MRKFITWVAALACAPAIVSAQILFSGQTGVSFLKSAPTESPRSMNSGRPLFSWESVLFVDATVTDDVTALLTVRASEGREVGFDYAAIQLADVTPLHLTIRGGKFALPFGNLGDRRFPRTNPLFSLPLIYEYRTSLPNHVSTESELVAGRGKGTGMRLLNLGMYDLGVMVTGSVGVLDYAVSVTNGTISSVSYDGGSSNSDLGKILRLAVTPTTGLTIGAAYARGAYLDDTGLYLAASGGADAYIQQAAEIDCEFSRGHFVFFGEGVYSRWPVPLPYRTENLDAFGFTLEGKFTLMPRLYVAARVGGLRFGDVRLQGETGPWDNNVVEFEGGFGYFIDRNVLLKLVRRETRIQGGGRPQDNLTVVQLAVAY